MPFYPPASISRTPATQTANDTTTYENTGFGAIASVPCRFTPGTTGRVFVLWTGDIVAGATAATIVIQGVYGTGVAPANNSAVTGTAYGAELAWVSLTGQLTQTFALHAIISGLVPGTDYYFDIATKGSTNTVQLTNCTFTAIEI